MKMVFYLGLFLTATLFSFGQTTEKKAPAPKGEQKKEQHVKVMVSQNGKVVKIDTTFNFADEKVVKFKVDSMLEKLGVNESGAGDKSVIVIHKGKEMHMGHAGGNMPGEKQINVFYEISDSAARKGGKKMVWHTDEGNVVMISDEGNMMPPPPPPPPMPGMHVRSFKMHGDPFAMDPNDKDIVTYDKKDIGKGLEKITIVRKKRPEHEQSKEVEVQVEVNEEKNK